MIFSARNFFLIPQETYFFFGDIVFQAKFGLLFMASLQTSKHTLKTSTETFSIIGTDKKRQDTGVFT